jgi:hypothetical protein
MLDAGYWILDAGCWLRKGGRLLGSEFGNEKIEIEIILTSILQKIRLLIKLQNLEPLHPEPLNPEPRTQNPEP